MINRKIVCFMLGSFILTFLITPREISATNFYVDAEYFYEVDSEGKTNSRIDVSIENRTSERLARSYLLNLQNFEPTNIKVNDRSGNELDFKEVRREGNSLLEIEFDNPAAGIGKTNNFTVLFDSFTFAEKVGDTWDIAIPKIQNTDEKRNYTVKIKVPESFGEEAFLSPKPSEVVKSDNFVLYKYSKNKLLSNNISLTFGRFQTYSFKINYHLENTDSHLSEVDLAIPPDTPYQTVYYEKIEPEPLNVKKDEDGNWIAIYKLEPDDKLDVTVEGYVNIFPFYRRDNIYSSPSQILTNTKPTDYWNYNDPQIKQLSSKLTTPEAIYNYVVSSLTYNYDRMYEDTQRLGAANALKNKEDALCMEFTDLFIALTRSAGIPAREINGFAYSNNPKIQPLSLVTDVLHSWPEYWDKERKLWIPVDPTWESTTGGRDYFNTFDVNHFVFVIHGKSDTIPYPPASYKVGSTPQKDIEVQIAELDVDSTEVLDINADIHSKVLSFNVPIEIKVHNDGNGAVYDKNVYIYYDNELIDSVNIEFLPPYGVYTIKENVNYGLFGLNAPENIKIVIGDSESVLSTNRSDVLIFHVLVLLGVVSIFVVFVFIKTRPNLKINFKPNVDIKKRIRMLLKNLREKNEPIFQNNDE